MVMLSLGLSILYYPSMPAEVVTRFDQEMNPVGSMPKIWAAFCFPVLSALSLLLVLGLSRTAVWIAAKAGTCQSEAALQTGRQVLERFNGWFIVWLAVLLLYAQTHVYYYSQGIDLRADIFLSVMSGVVLFLIGGFSSSVPQNPFFGVRTSWTLRSERVWKNTNRLAGVLFRLCGVAVIAGGLFAFRYLVLWVIVPVIVSALVSAAYSYFDFQREKK